MKQKNINTEADRCDKRYDRTKLKKIETEMLDFGERRRMQGQLENAKTNGATFCHV